MTQPRVAVRDAGRYARRSGQEDEMPRFREFVPQGVIPAALLPFTADLAIDEAAFRRHLGDLAASEGVPAITISAHPTECAWCSFEEQRRVLAIARDAVGARLPL